MGRNFNRKFSSSGFTLIEVLIVIAVIGIMAAGLVAVLNPMAQIQKANDAKRKSDLNQIQKALEAYYNDYGKYPLNLSGDYRIKGLDGNSVSWGNPWAPYMGTLPKDPSSSRKYVYCSSGQSYYLYSSLERGGSITANYCGGSTICGSGVPTCNYGVSSSNVSP